MKKILLLFAFLFISNKSISQDFTKKEIKRFEKVLKRSNSKIRNFDKNSLVSVEKLNNGDVEGLIENALFLISYTIVRP